MRVIVTGDRNWYAPDLAEHVLNRLMVRYGPNLVIVHGAATSIDRLFAGARGEMEIEHEAHPARWDELDHPGAVSRHGKRNRPYNANTGPIRNQEMVETGTQMCLAFHRAISASNVVEFIMWRSASPPSLTRVTSIWNAT